MATKAKKRIKAAKIKVPTKAVKKAPCGKTQKKPSGKKLGKSPKRMPPKKASKKAIAKPSKRAKRVEKVRKRAKKTPKKKTAVREVFKIPKEKKRRKEKVEVKIPLVEERQPVVMPTPTVYAPPAPPESGAENICPYCKGRLVRDYKHAEIVCSKCGTVVEDEIADLGAETRSFDSEAWLKKTRTGSPMTYTKPHKGLTTEIDKYDRDIRGGTVSKEARKRMYRMRKWQRRINVSSSVEKDIIPALNEISRELSELGLPISMKEDAAIMYRKICNRGLVRGRSIEAIIAAITYILCRDRNIPRTLGEIADVSGIDPKDVGKTYRYVARHLTLKVPPTTPADYLPKFAHNVGLPNYVVDKAKEIIEDAKKLGLTSGRAPAGVAAAVLYIAADIYNMQKTQKEIADAAGVTEVTVRNRHRELEEKMDLYKYKEQVLKEKRKSEAM